MARPRPTVLVVDDDDATRQGLAVLLDSWGYQASEAENGKAALAACDKELPQAIVTDLMMPGMTGLEFVAALGERVQQVEDMRGSRGRGAARVVPDLSHRRFPRRGKARG